MDFLFSSFESICTCDMHSCLLQVAFLLLFWPFESLHCYIPLPGLTSYISITRDSIQ